MATDEQLLLIAGSNCSYLGFLSIFRRRAYLINVDNWRPKLRSYIWATKTHLTHHINRCSPVVQDCFSSGKSQCGRRNRFFELKNHPQWLTKQLGSISLLEMSPCAAPRRHGGGCSEAQTLINEPVSGSSCLWLAVKASRWLIFPGAPTEEQSSHQETSYSNIKHKFLISQQLNKICVITGYM